MNITTDQIFSYAVTAVACVAAGVERWKAGKVTQKSVLEKEVVSDAKRQEERGNLMAKMADDYKELLEKEYTAHQHTRDFYHNKSSEDQAKLAKCSERCLELQAKTDLSKIEELILDQSTALKIVAEGIQKLLQK